MTVDQLLEQIKKMFPKADLEAWGPGYRAAFGYGGVKLDDAWRKTMAGWTKSTAPKPGDIGKHLENFKNPTAAGKSGRSRLHPDFAAKDHPMCLFFDWLEEREFDFDQYWKWKKNPAKYESDREMTPIPASHIVRENWRKIPMPELTFAERQLCTEANAVLVRSVQADLMQPFKRMPQ